MPTFWTWAGEHPWLAFWLMLWSLVIGGGLIGSIIKLLVAVFFRLPNRMIRGASIRARGWPPEHLDADGDFRPAPKEQEAA